MHHADAGTHGVAGGGEMVQPADAKFARVGRWMPARILPSVDFPAPFSPINPWHSPAHRKRDAVERLDPAE